MIFILGTITKVLRKITFWFGQYVKQIQPILKVHEAAEVNITMSSMVPPAPEHLNANQFDIALKQDQPELWFTASVTN